MILLTENANERDREARGGTETFGASRSLSLVLGKYLVGQYPRRRREDKGRKGSR